MLWEGTTGGEALLLIGFFLYGFGFGGTIPLSESLWTSCFGRSHIGAIRGISQPISSLGLSFASVIVGFWFDAVGRYAPAFTALAAVYVVAAICLGVSRPQLDDRERSLAAGSSE